MSAIKRKYVTTMFDVVVVFCGKRGEVEKRGGGRCTCNQFFLRPSGPAALPSACI